MELSYEIYRFLEARWLVFIVAAAIMCIAGRVIGKYVEQKREILGGSIASASPLVFVGTILLLLGILAEGSTNILTSRSVGNVTNVIWGEVSTLELGEKRVAVRGMPDYWVGQEAVMEERWDGNVLACLDECYRVVALGVSGEEVSLDDIETFAQGETPSRAH